MYLLLVEDDLKLGTALSKLLKQHYRVNRVRTLESAKSHLETAEYDVMLLDLGLPDGDGVSWLHSLRASGCNTPVLIVTVRPFEPETRWHAFACCCVANRAARSRSCPSVISDSMLTRERQFASDVAHELRTPLTTLKLELSGSDPDLAAVKSEVDRVSRLMEQLLTLARLEQGQWQRRFESVSLRDTVGGVPERFAGKFRSSGMTLACRGTANSVTGDATLLDMLVQNLLQNMLLHCPPGMHADVLLDDTPAGVRVRVVDNGPGMANDTRRQMAQGFRQLDNKSEGLGLGLAICHRIAEVRGAAISFPAREDGGSELVAEVIFTA